MRYILTDTTRIYNNDTGMSFRWEKCIWMVTKRGKVVTTEGTALPEGNIANIEDSPKQSGKSEEQDLGNEHCLGISC